MWTEEHSLTLINAYRSKECLWDPKHAHYFNKIKKNDAWKQVSRELNECPEGCKKKISSMMSSLRREKAKMKKSMGTGAGRSDVYESSWFAFNSMRFLWDKDTVRDTQSTITNEGVMEMDEQDDNRHNQASIDTPPAPEENLESEKSTTRIQRNNPPTKFRKTKNADDARLDKAFEILTKASMSQELSEQQIFGNLVAKKLEKYTQEAQTAVQQAIMTILFEADRGHYDRYPIQDQYHPYSHPITQPQNLQYLNSPQSQTCHDIHQPSPANSHHSTTCPEPASIPPPSASKFSLNIPDIDF